MSQKSYDNSPTVYLIPTPIGNLEDITLRAINILNKVDVIFSEDTRVTRLLLTHLKINKKLISSHNFNEQANVDKILKYLNDGSDVGIVTDRGTPIISDPGFELVKSAIDSKYNVVSLPGPTALIPALTVSGLSPMPFLFYGFLNNKDSKRRKELKELSSLPYTFILYESPHRLSKTLVDMEKILGNRNICISREISKKFEEVYRGKITELVAETVEIKGEIVIVVEGNTIKEEIDITDVDEHIKKLISNGLSPKDAIKEVSSIYGLKKNDLYKKYHRGES